MTASADVGRPVASSRRWMIAGGIAAGVIAADQATKSWAVSSLNDGQVIEVIGTLQFRLAFNTGMSFSLGSGLGQLIAPLAIVVVITLFWFARRVQSTLGLVAIGLVAGGAIGNLVDRAVRAGDGFFGGAVVDFIDVQWWPVFNIADMGVVIGAGLLLLSTWFEDELDEELEAEHPGGEGTDEHHPRDDS